MAQHGFARCTGANGAIREADHKLYVRDLRHGQLEQPLITSIPIRQIPVEPLHAKINIVNARFRWTCKMAHDHQASQPEPTRRIVAEQLKTLRLVRPFLGFTGKGCDDLLTRASDWIPAILNEHSLLDRILESWQQVDWLLRNVAVRLVCAAVLRLAAVNSRFGCCKVIQALLRL